MSCDRRCGNPDEVVEDEEFTNCLDCPGRDAEPVTLNKLCVSHVGGDTKELIAEFSNGRFQGIVIRPGLTRHQLVCTLRQFIVNLEKDRTL